MAVDQHDGPREHEGAAVAHEGDGHLLDPPLIAGNPSFHDITELVASHSEKRTPVRWFVAFAIASSVLMMMLIMLAYQVWNGVGVWGNNIPVGWAWPIVDFVFWVGIGHAGTLISAILFLFRQRWRTSINRSAEAMTIFAVICALVFPLFHTGRVWVAVYWCAHPEPDEHVAEVQKPAAVGRFCGLELLHGLALFWYVGLIPDLATLRDRATSIWRRRVLGFFSMGWRVPTVTGATTRRRI